LPKDKIGQGDNALVLIFTDGAASDKSTVTHEITEMAKWMTEDSQCALEIVYV